MIYDIISTGSKGNAVVINDKILIDCGVPFKKLSRVYESLSIVLLTHKHTDHFNKRTIKKLAEERPTLRFACGKWLVPDVVKCGVKKRNIDVVESGKIYDYKAFKISPFTLYHDVENIGLNYSQVSRHKKAHFFGGAGYFVCSQYKASASFGVSILSVPCGLFVL